MENTAIVFGSTGGATEFVARQIAKKIDKTNVEVLDVANISSSDLDAFQNLILGTSTWGIGDLQDDWEGFLPELSNVDLSGKIIALYGLGDSASYGDSFVDGMGTIYEAIKDKGGEVVGHVDAEAYTYDDSKAVYDGKFIGLALDEDNESDLTDSRIEDWLGQILSQFN